MNAKDIFNKIKLAFAEPVAPVALAAPVVVPVAAPVVPDAEPALGTNVISYAVDGGVPVYTDIADDNTNGIDAADKVFTDEALTIPYPDGTFKVTGTDFSFTVSAGSVTVIDDINGTGAGMPIPDEADPMVDPATVSLAGAPVAPTMEERMAAVETELAKMKMPAMPAGMATEIQLQAATQKVDKHETTIKGLFDLVELLVKQPAAEPATLPENKKDSFKKKQESRIEAIAAAMTSIKK